MKKKLCEFEYALGRYCGATLARIKPSSLFSLDLSHLSRLYGMREDLEKIGIQFAILRTCNLKARVFIYNQKQLSSLLFRKEIKEFLYEYGYDYKDADDAISQLKDKFNKYCFPHEVGVFLGYDLDDVKGFINNPHDAHILCGHWKVYSNPKEKEKLFERYKRCTKNICNRLENGQSLKEIFKMA